MDAREAFHILHQAVNDGTVNTSQLVLVAEWLKTMIAENEEPTFTHTCSSCIFLGGYYPPIDQGWEPYYDLYWCPQTGVPTIYARYGNAGHEYTSGSPLEQENYEKSHDRPTYEGYRRAKAKGLPIADPR